MPAQHSPQSLPLSLLADGNGLSDAKTAGLGRTHVNHIVPLIISDCLVSLVVLATEVQARSFSMVTQHSDGATVLLPSTHPPTHNPPLVNTLISASGVRMLLPPGLHPIPTSLMEPLPQPVLLPPREPQPAPFQQSRLPHTTTVCHGALSSSFKLLNLSYSCGWRWPGWFGCC